MRLCRRGRHICVSVGDGGAEGSSGDTRGSGGGTRSKRVVKEEKGGWGDGVEGTWRQLGKGRRSDDDRGGLTETSEEECL